MASLQARHTRKCKIVRARAEAKARAGKPGGVTLWTSFTDATKAAGCTCKPAYFVALRHGGKLIYEPAGPNRKEAERLLDARRGDIARRTFRVVRDIRFDEWGDEWLSGFTGKPSSRLVYSHSIAYGKQTFGAVKVRDLTNADVRRFLETIRRAYIERHPAKKDEPQREVSQATLAKHLRQLGACLQAAVTEGYATENPVRGLHKTARPKVPKSRPAYFTDPELARLWPELAYRPVMLALCKTAVGTGARLGELAALRWDDVDLLSGELHIARSFTEGFGETPPKSGQPRTIDLTPPAAKVLEGWFAESGGDGLVFEREEGGHLTSGYMLRRVLIPALERAGIPRVGEQGGTRDFHSFRHTFARIALEGGAEITWVQRQLGHSSIGLTVDTYGHWSRAAQKAQAKKLARAFKL
jgi:integrase